MSHVHARLRSHELLETEPGTWQQQKDRGRTPILQPAAHLGDRPRLGSGTRVQLHDPTECRETSVLREAILVQREAPPQRSH